MVDTLCSDEFVDVGVDEVFATLLDDGTYLCSPSTMHRILRDRGLSGQRRQANPRKGHHRPRVVATAPNMVWVWDISRIPGPAKGVWFYLYLVMDLWSRKAVGWCVDIEETAAVAEKLIATIAAREGIARHQLEVHSDRGAQMTSGTLAELYDTLGVRRSLSRPRVSNDNPHAEAAFKNRPTGLTGPKKALGKTDADTGTGVHVSTGTTSSSWGLEPVAACCIAGCSDRLRHTWLRLWCTWLLGMATLSRTSVEGGRSIGVGG
ncbi:MAG: transposase family protein [Candidatus Microthrix sp.]|nr:transposase family protein [Candidatus Microthrix sp.]